MRVTILNKYWKLKFTRIRHHGECQHPDKPNKQITINSQLRGERLLDCLLHELLHASAHDLFSEQWVEDTAHDLAKILWRLEYRRESEHADTTSA